MRTNSIFLFSILLILILAGFSCSRSGEESYRPNIIFLFTDDQRDNTLSSMGHPWVRTPNLDQLLSKGIRFSNTYSAEPTCSPSRTSVFTGVYERVHGVGFSSSYQLTEDQWEKTYPSLLRDAGYYTGFVGKFGVEYYTFRGKASEKFDFWRAHDGWTRFFPKDFDTFECEPYHDAEEDIITPIIGEGIEMFFNDLPGDKPFCLSVSFNVPHGSQTSTMHTECENWQSMMTPANENPKLKGHPIYDTLYRNTPFPISDDCTRDPHQFIPKHLLDQDAGRNWTYKYSYNPVSCREHYVRYYQTITGLDKVIGDLTESLDNMGLAENTIIIYASDHGLLMGEYGMGGKALLYDYSSKIPCIVFDPSIPVKERGKTMTNLVSSLDITSTILDYAGIDAPEHMEGLSLVPLIEGRETPWREEIFLENLFVGRDDPVYEGIRQGKWKYIRMFDHNNPQYLEEDVNFRDREPDFEQLFNLELDPTEHFNLVEQYEGSAILEELRMKCSELSNDQNMRREEYKKEFAVEPR